MRGSTSGIEKAFQQYAVFSYIWGFGGDLPTASRPRFEAIARTYVDLYITEFPALGSIFDYIPDSRGAFVHTSHHTSPTMMTLAPLAPEMPLYAPTSDGIVCTYLLQVMTAHRRNILVTGERGSGKSLLLQQFLRRRKYEETQVTFRSILLLTAPDPHHSRGVRV